MKQEQHIERKCFIYICPLYPKCRTAAAGCCGVDDYFESSSLLREECFDLPDKPFFKEKTIWKPPGA